MVKTTIGACASVLAALVFSLSVFAADDSTHWHWKYDNDNSATDPTLSESDWHPYCDAANWTVGTTGQNPQNRWPTQNDILYYGDYYNGIMAFDMGGNDIAVYGIDDTYTHNHPAKADSSWGYHKIILRNGSLTLNNCFTNTRTHFNVWSGGAAKLADSCKSRLGYGGAATYWYVHDGGYARLAGEADWISFDVDVFPGGLVDVDFARLTHIQASTDGFMRNSGTLNFPHGLAMTGTPSSGSMTISQNAGTMSIGGDMSKASAGYGVNLYLNGGTVEFTGNSTLSGYSTALVSNAAPVTVSVAAGKTADYRLIQFMSGAQLTKEGGGVFVVGGGAPASVTVSSGTLGSVGVNFSNGLSLSSGTTLRIYGNGTSATSIAGLSGATVDIDPNLSDGTTVFTSSNASLLSSVLSKLQTSSGTLGTFSTSGSDIVFHRSHAPSVFYWKGGFSTPYKSFGDANNWGVGVTSTATNPNHLIPGATDWIHYIYDYSFNAYWDLGNKHHTIKGFDFTDWTTKGSQWGFHRFYIQNGTLEISQNFTNQRVTVSLESNAKFILGPNSSTRLSQGDAQSWYTVKSGCEMIMGGYLDIVIPMIEVFDGGKLSFEPKELAATTDFRTASGHPDPYIRNHGTMNFPNGFNFLRGGNSTIPGTFTIDNCAGTMTFDGPILKGDAAYGIFNFLFNGGKVVFNQSADLRWFASAGSTNVNSTTTIQVANGQHLYLPGGKYAAGSKLVKEGGGSISFGIGLPNSLQIKAGDLRLEGAGSEVQTLEMASGSTLTIAAPGTTINTFNGYANINFVVDVSQMGVGSIVLKSSNDALLTSLKNKAVLPSGYYLEKSTGRLTLANDSLGYVFNCLGEKQMNDPSGWTTGQVAPAGADVFIKGNQTVAVLDSTMNVYNSITVMNGGTLKLKDMTSMPNLSLLYDAKVIVASGTGLTIGAGQITCEAEETAIPTLEIAAGAKATFGTNTEFKNMNFVLLGEMKFIPPFFFGTAGSGETTYFNMAATNAVIDMTGGSGMIVYWMTPQAATGRVKSPKGISLRKVTFNPPTGVYWRSFLGWYSSNVKNPNDEVFDIIVDGTQFPIMQNTSQNHWASGARIRTINGGMIGKDPNWVSAPGTYGWPQFEGAVEMTFEGENTYFGYYYDRYSVDSIPDDDGRKQMTFKNGASFRAPHFNAYFNDAQHNKNSPRAIFSFENGFFDVVELPGYDRAMWGGWIWRSTQYEFQNSNGGGHDIPPGLIDHSDLCKTNFFSPAFRGLKEVQIPANCKLGFRGVNWYGIKTVKAVPNDEPNPSASKEILFSNEWDRVIWTDDQVPITGGGSIYVCNTVSNQSMAAIIRCGQNTATGRAWAEEDTVGNGNRLYFADGANWAGTVVASERLGLTNVAENARAANVTFNTIDFEGPLDIRVWRDDMGPTNDCVTILSSGFRPEPGCINPVPMGGYAPKVGDTFVIAQLPSGVPNMAGRGFLANKRWVLVDEIDPDSVRRLKLRYVPGGILLNFRGAPPPES